MGFVFFIQRLNTFSDYQILSRCSIVAFKNLQLVQVLACRSHWSLFLDLVPRFGPMGCRSQGGVFYLYAIASV